MNKSEARTKIKKVVSEVETTWLAADGGLTAAAADTADMGRIALCAIQNNNRALWPDIDPFDADTGAEADIITAYLVWAGRW